MRWAYALERCERSARWVQESRSLARKLEELPEIRRALLTGRLSWSMACVIASEATPADEATWLADAQGRPVREMRARVKERRSTQGVVSDQRAGEPATRQPEQGTVALDAPGGDDEDFHLLTITVDREDAWRFEAVRMMVRHLCGARTDDDVLEALLAEGLSTLCRWVPRHAFTEPEEDPANAAQRAWEAELARWREQADIRCEGRVLRRTREREREQRDDDGETGDVGLDVRFEGNAVDIDRDLRRIASELATRDVAIGRLAERFWKADGWRRLGYATDSQYARERLGMSLSSVKAKRHLVCRLGRLPRVAQAIAGGELGYEAARLVTQVATPETVDEWVDRARERTVRSLRDEVDATEMIARLSAERSVEPPSEELMSEVERVESAIVSGAAFVNGSASNSQTSAPPRNDSASNSETSAPPPPADATRPDRKTRARGRVTLRLRVRAGTRRLYRWLERLYGRYRRAKVSFFHFLCGSFIEIWKSSLGSEVAYASVYARDRYHCTSPVCRRTDVTPHHLKFRSRGGDDLDANVSSLCTWCHLEGIHGGRLAAEPPASSIRWTIGRNRHTVVEGRRRMQSSL